MSDRGSGPPPARWASALSLLGWIERRSDAANTWRRRTYRVDGRHAVHEQLQPRDLSRPLSGMARAVPDDAARTAARCRADLLARLLA